MAEYIGVFDSGLGGLTNVKELNKLLPDENIIYFGDTGRVPYGSRSKETIIKYTLQDIRFLKSFPIKAIVVACGTVSSIALDTIKDTIDIPIIGVVEPTCKKAMETTRNGKIGIIGTEGTIKSGSYRNKMQKANSKLEIYEKACPLFVPLVENGYVKKDATYLIAQEYLQPLKEKGVDTLILGCTHYPLLSEVIGDIMGNDVRLINPGVETAVYTKEFLKENNLLTGSGILGNIEYYVSDDVEKFSYLAQPFLGNNNVLANVKKINIEEW